MFIILIFFCYTHHSVWLSMISDQFVSFEFGSNFAIVLPNGCRFFPRTTPVSASAFFHAAVRCVMLCYFFRHSVIWIPKWSRLKWLIRMPSIKQGIGFAFFTQSDSLSQALLHAVWSLHIICWYWCFFEMSAQVIQLDPLCDCNWFFCSKYD